MPASRSLCAFAPIVSATDLRVGLDETSIRSITRAINASATHDEMLQFPAKGKALKAATRGVGRVCRRPVTREGGHRQRNGGSGSHSQIGRRIGVSFENLTETRTEFAVESGTADLEQEISTVSRPSHLL